MALYDRVRNTNNEYIPQFVGSAIPEINLAASSTQNRYDTALDNYDKLEALGASIDVWDPEIKEAAINNIRGVINDVAANKGAWENAGLLIRQKARELQNNEALKASAANKKAILQEEALVNEMRAKGYTPLRFNTPDNFKTLNPDGSLNRYQSDVQRQLDYDQVKEGLWNQIKADATSGKLQPAELGELKYYLEQGSWQGISNKKIKDYLNSAMSRYKSTPEYQQEFRKLTELQGVDPTQADKMIEQSVLDTGLERVFSQSDTNYTLDKVGLAGAGSDTPPNTPQDYEGDTGITLKNPTALTADDLSLKENVQVQNTKTPMGYIPGVDINKGTVSKYQELKGEKKKQFNAVVSSLGLDAPGISEEEQRLGAIEYYEKGIVGYKDGQPISVTGGKPITNRIEFPIIHTTDFVRRGEEGRSTREDVKDDIEAGNYEYRTFVDLETGKVYQGRDDEFKELITVDGKIDPSLIDPIGEYDVKNSFSKIANSKELKEGVMADPLAVTIDGKRFAMSRSLGEMSTPQHRANVAINTVYAVTQETPGIIRDVELFGEPAQVRGSIYGYTIVLSPGSPNSVTGEGSTITAALQNLQENAK